MSCEAKARDLAPGPPRVPAGFWDNDRMRDALAAWMGTTQALLSRIENGSPVQNLDKLIYWARVLEVPPHLLWFKLVEHRHLPLYAPGTVTGQPAAPDAVVSRRDARVPDPSRRTDRRGGRPGRPRPARRIGTTGVAR